MPKISNGLNNSKSRLQNIYSIPAECDFLQVLVKSLMDGTLIDGFHPKDDPLLLSSVTIFVPNRRAARALSTAFLSTNDEEALLLPEIRTLGDVGDEDFGITADSSHFGQPGEEIKPLERTLQLANLVQHWVDAMEEETRRLYDDEDIIIPSSRADAVLLAQDLSILLGQITQEEIDWSAIRNIVPDNHAEWWKLTTTFLNILMEAWPEHLQSKGLLDPAERAAKLLDLRTEFYLSHNNEGPVIVAGSTGSVASTRRLLKAVASLRDGAVILPGLDKSISSIEWQALGDTKEKDQSALETHPQFGLAQLLANMNVDRDTVKEIGRKTTNGSYRQKILGLAMAPAKFTSNWLTHSSTLEHDKIQQAFATISIIDATNERQEALAIAIALREILTDPSKTAALVTPDRNLARRVSMELLRYDINVDDTGGSPLKNSRTAIFMRQILQVCFLPFQNSELAALLKNAFLLVGQSSEDAQHLARTFELACLRGVIKKPVPGNFETFVKDRKCELASAKHISSPVKRITEDDWQSLAEYAGRIDEILKPLIELSCSNEEFPLEKFFLKVAVSAEALSLDDDGVSQILSGEGAIELKRLFEDVIVMEECQFFLRAHDFPSVFEAILKSVVTRPRGNTHPRLHIYGPLEVRLLEHDRVILAGLNEGTWPQTTRNDAFLNRLMRQELGMSSPERRTGLAAHDFQQLMGKKEVFLSRSSRVDKSPTVASRWLQRLSALIGDKQTANLRKRGDLYLQYADQLDKSTEENKRVERPNPKPPVAARPTSLAVTDIETWIRDPYALYSKRILKLNPLDPLEREPDPMLKGTLYHAIMQEYAETVDASQPGDKRLQSLISLSKKQIEEQKLPTDISAVWQLRFEEIAEAYIAWEDNYHSKQKVAARFCEIEGSLKLANDSFHLRARADRIDVNQDGSVHIIDYKTGVGPSIKQAQSLSPQLALEGLIATKGGFDEGGSGEIADLTYLRLRRGKEFKAQSISTRDQTPGNIINNAKSELLKLVKGYQYWEQGYLSRRAPFKDGDISGDYDHLARTREWSFGEDEGDGS